MSGATQPDLCLNSQIFLLWMLGTSLVLLTVAILFLRNQIKPILRLAEAADSLGKGRPTPPDFRPRGAREVRQAARTAIEMRDRIERHVEQRTTMLAGVSHDLRTVLTRFKLQLAMFEDRRNSTPCAPTSTRCRPCSKITSPSRRASGEEIVRTDISEILTEVRNQAHGKSDIRIDVGNAPLVVPLRRRLQPARRRQSRQQRGTLRRPRGGQRRTGGRLARGRGRGRRTRHPGE